MPLPGLQIYFRLHVTLIIGISGPVLGWLTCYLSNRTQFVQRVALDSSHQPSFAVYHKARFSDRSCFCFTPQTSLDWRLRMVAMFISMRMTRRYTLQEPYRWCSTTTRRRLHLCWWYVHMDKKQLPAAEHQEDRSAVVRVQTTPRSDSCRTTLHQRRQCHARQLCSGPRCLPGRRCVHDNTHFTNGCELFQHPTPDTERPEVAASSCCYVAGHQPCADEAGLLQLGASWPSSEPPEPAPGCHQRSSQADLLS